MPVVQVGRRTPGLESGVKVPGPSRREGLMSKPQEAQRDETSGFDASKPNMARVYDYMLGGKDNFAADRAEAERLINLRPQLPRDARENRQFLTRAVTWLAQQGIHQFLDIG